MSPDEVGGADESGGAAGAGEAAPAPIDPRLVEYARTHDRALRNALVEDNMGLALHFTTRYRRSDTEDDDLRQVALLGLVKAIDRFDPTRGVAFSTFAGRTIDGELKRHFRDQTWALRVPRSVKDLHVSVRRASEALEQQLSRSPTVRELADHLDVSVDEVIGALGATAARRAGSLDDLDPQGATTTPRTVSSPAEDLLEDRDEVGRLLSTLGPREREIIRLRFYEHLSQEQIAERVGLSQMHVSRLLRRSFEQMRRSGTPPS
ncbi:MAG TPA: sigma-70 family RNA polymerase sigma factor [Microthrixaceae bacterium]|nr:sigma-70 family RNA polymerase sigma factor [Microthrixaceae bacterium]HMV74381.1 sigma-70 family RNA polymerase sigma factor [Microthrixaceae bacterium]HMX65746.1 sigma-70 family RNA polymerase sigma factor [Microthrixaceae bacterium]HNE35757.1 sigma-70 family RNA polymerase sigma factor [Microthrixaceae bacterium]HNJ21950.1 sigma-70 family RNA polymerase sigma factor [Microthrixaceae bacterium]